MKRSQDADAHTIKIGKERLARCPHQKQLYLIRKQLD